MLFLCLSTQIIYHVFQMSAFGTSVLGCERPGQRMHQLWIVQCCAGMSNATEYRSVITTSMS